MFQPARPVSAPTPLQPPAARCPQCGTPVSGIGAVRPGRHEFVDCGHRASARAVDALARQ